ncbi:MAG: carboxypeptidase-like regulatory domain-containing protein, partial [Bacteroidales bacterium]|nr:carboxypeptidase-like regulatory domain-containing protein [Bacteroidales bacterium]
MIVRLLTKTRTVLCDKVFFFVLLLSFFVSGMAQQREVSGVVLDKKGDPVAFANVFVDNTTIGTITDISGNFSLSVESGHKRLHIKCMGFDEVYANIPADGGPIKVRMKESVFMLKDVVVKPGINPANRIIQAAIDNKKKNDFQKQNSYSYTSYNRGVIEFAHDEETSMRQTAKNFISKGDSVRDSFEIFVDEIIDSTYLFFTESVSEYKYKSPDRVSENVIATRTAGTENPIFSIILTQMQSTSFYSSNFNILGVPYINPIRKGTFRRYFFLLQDTIYQGNDTVFGIMFYPQPNKEFNSLKGKVFINSNGYAIQSIVAEPVKILSTFNSLAMATNIDTAKDKNADSLAVSLSLSASTLGMAEKDNSLVFRIKHTYATDSLGRWYPDFLHFELGMRMSKKNDILIRFTTSNKIDGFTFNPKLKRREFSDVTLNIDEEAITNDTAVWNRYRPAITEKEKNTFILYDSINEAIRKETPLTMTDLIDWLMQLFSGKIKIKQFAIDINKIFNYNGYEHSRWGLGMEWNVTKWMRPSGYFGYGVEDKEWKYGGTLDFFFDRYKNY